MVQNLEIGSTTAGVKYGFQREGARIGNTES